MIPSCPLVVGVVGGALFHLYEHGAADLRPQLMEVAWVFYPKHSDGGKARDVFSILGPEAAPLAMSGIDETEQKPRRLMVVAFVKQQRVEPEANQPNT
jgi:hypothetical protein